jgi:hypothetical protein
MLRYLIPVLLLSTAALAEDDTPPPTPSMLDRPVASLQPPDPPTAEEITAQAAIQIGQLQTAVGRLQLETIALRKRLAAAAAPAATPAAAEKQKPEAKAPARKP